MRENGCTFEKLSRLIDEKACVARLSEACRDLRDEATSELPFLYGASLLGVRSRWRDAVALLMEVESLSCFGEALQDYLIRHKGAATKPAFLKARPFDVWSKTSFYERHMESALDVMGRFMEGIGSFPRLQLIDLGTGNGMLFAVFVRRMFERQLLHSGVAVLIDQSEDMLSVARQRCASIRQLEFRYLQRTIESLTSADFKTTGPVVPTVALAALSLHHLSEEAKRTVLQMLQEVAEYCIVVEMHGNHDVPEQGSVELIRSVAEVYGYFVADITNSNLSHCEKQVCLDGLVMAEAIAILTRPRITRGDYHTPLDRWQSIAEAAGYTVVQTAQLVTLPRRPVTFALQLRRDHSF